MVRAALPLNVVPDASPVPALLKVTAFATLPAEPVVFWFKVGTSAAWIADMTTSVPLPRRYCPEVTAPARASIAACRVVSPVPPLAMSIAPVNVCDASQAAAPVALNVPSAGVEWLTVKVMPET